MREKESRSVVNAHQFIIDIIEKKSTFRARIAQILVLFLALALSMALNSKFRTVVRLEIL